MTFEHTKHNFIYLQGTLFTNLRKTLKMKHLFFAVLAFAIFSSCQDDEELIVCEEDIQGDYFSAIATNVETGETFKEVYPTIRNYNRCFQFSRDGTFPDGRDTMTNDYFSKVFAIASSEEWVDLEFFHGPECDQDGFNTIVTFALAKIPLGDQTFAFGMSNFEPLNLGLLSAFSALTVEGDASITELQFANFGQNIGDLIEGRLFSDRVRAADIEPSGRPAFLNPDDGTRYEVEINFRFTVEE